MNRLARIESTLRHLCRAQDDAKYCVKAVREGVQRVLSVAFDELTRQRDLAKKRSKRK